MQKDPTTLPEIESSSSNFCFLSGASDLQTSKCN